jgi:hypothetical protein
MEITVYKDRCAGVVKDKFYTERDLFWMSSQHSGRSRRRYRLSINTLGYTTVNGKER